MSSDIRNIDDKGSGKCPQEKNNFIGKITFTKISEVVKECQIPYPSLQDEILRDVHEIRIQMPWGHIAGKWWGPRNVRPILCLHGWQDSAASFDRLIPHLPSHLSYLAIDLPGHGFSSHIQPGMRYSQTTMWATIYMVVEMFKWDKVSVIGHSMSSILTFVLVSLFPSRVDVAIAIDFLKPPVLPTDDTVDIMEFHASGFLKSDKLNEQEIEPPSYMYDELVQRVIDSTYSSLTTDDAKYLLKRTIKQSSSDPDKYYFVRDNRIKFLHYDPVSQEACMTVANLIKCPYLFIKASDSPYYEDKQYFDEVVDVLRTRNKHFQMEIVDGPHYVHLTDPLKVGAVVTRFLNKHRPSDAKSML